MLGSFWRILDISKRILELLSGNSGKNFGPYFGNYVAKPEEGEAAFAQGAKSERGARN